MTTRRLAGRAAWRGTGSLNLNLNLSVRVLGWTSAGVSQRSAHQPIRASIAQSADKFSPLIAIIPYPCTWVTLCLCQFMRMILCSSVPQDLCASVPVHLSVPFCELPFPGPVPKIKPGAPKRARTSITMFMGAVPQGIQDRIRGVASVEMLTIKTIRDLQYYPRKLMAQYYPWPGDDRKEPPG